MRKPIWILGLSLLVFNIIQAAEHNPLLPQPQKVKYGDSRLELEGLKIGFAAAPSPEDRFAAKQLAHILTSVSGFEVDLTESLAIPVSIIFERTGAVDPLPVPGEKAGRESREAYKILIGAESVRISSKSSAGLFYAVQTIRQLVEGTGKEAVLPEVEIEDWPVLAFRGFMMDMSHTQLPRMDEIKRHLDFLSSWKANQYYFYSEASIELEGYPLLMADARFTKNQVREIIEYGRERHIDVVPNLELYGHTHDLLRLEHYSDMGVIPHGGEFRPDDPGVEPLIADWVKQISSLFPSPFLHIGFDETWLIKKEAEKMGMDAEDLYLKMLTQAVNMTENYGKRVLCYADMLQKFPVIIPRIPEQTIAIAWHYFPKEESAYEPLMKPFQNEGIEMFIQPASLNWGDVVPRFAVGFTNMNLLVKMGRKYGATGFINSGWTDDTQTLMRQSFPDMAFGSAAAWQDPAVDEDLFFESYTKILYPEEMAASVESAHRSMMKAHAIIVKAVGISSDLALFDNPFKERHLERISEYREDLSEGRLEAEKAQIELMKAMKFGIDSTTLATIFYGAKALDYIALKYMYAGEINDFWEELMENPDDDQLRSWFRMEMSFKYHTRTSDMLDAISVLKDLFRDAWLNEYTPFRLGIGLGKYDLELQNWLTLQKKMESRVWNFSRENPLPPLHPYFD